MSRHKKTECEENSSVTVSQDARYIVTELEKYFDQRMDPVNLSSRYTLTPEETARYTHIGLNTIRGIISANPYAEWLIHVGNKNLIIRPLFEEYLKGGKRF